VPKDKVSAMAPTGSILFPAEAIKGLQRFFELFLVKTHFVEGC
jgi:hypothetical protein